jgi:hypothetical protein
MGDVLAVIISPEDSLWLLARIDSHQHGITGLQSILKLGEEFAGIVALEIAQARAEPKNGFGLRADASGLEPLQTVIICPIKTKAFHMLVTRRRDLGEGPLQLIERQVKGIVFGILTCAFDCLEEDVNFAEIPGG